MTLNDVLAILAITGAVSISIISGKIDRVGGVVGGLITYFLFLGIGSLGIALIGSFFVLGTFASWWKQEQKAAWNVAEARGGQRGWRNVIANAGVAGIIATVSWWEPDYVDSARLLVSACFASALSDTWSSEFGNIYGNRFYNVLTGKRDQRGRDGVVSLEGSAAGVLGSGIIALLYGTFEGIGYRVGIVVIAGVAGNLMDSIVGATLERKGLVGNHTVNFLNTLTAALLAYFFVKSCSIST